MFGYTLLFCRCLYSDNNGCMLCNSVFWLAYHYQSMKTHLYLYEAFVSILLGNVLISRLMISGQWKRLVCCVLTYMFANFNFNNCTIASSSDNQLITGTKKCKDEVSTVISEEWDQELWSPAPILRRAGCTLWEEVCCWEKVAWCT